MKMAEIKKISSGASHRFFWLSPKEKIYELSVVQDNKVPEIYPS